MNPDVVEDAICHDSRGEMKMWSACLLQGIRDYKDGHRDAVYWLWSDDIFVGSFVWLCDLFNINPEYAREKVRNAA